MAPEILNGSFYNYKVDIWSVGVSIFESLFGTTPFFGRDLPDLTSNVNIGFIRIPTSITLTSGCIDFLSKCLHYDPQQRISIDHSLNHPFINPESPQYMDKIHLIRKSKYILNYAGTTAIPSQSDLNKYQYLNVHDGKIYDEGNINAIEINSKYD